uniref:Uncharacterized protein n=1 Tax=Trypanosoma vivax (strain Y486) TaxID=1055687 RepID=G0UB17_TRYVY|nr:conserved hypothetical protein [Trypanosoma vivax Y486]
MPATPRAQIHKSMRSEIVRKLDGQCLLGSDNATAGLLARKFGSATPSARRAPRGRPLGTASAKNTRCTARARSHHVAAWRLTSLFSRLQARPRSPSREWNLRTHDPVSNVEPQVHRGHITPRRMPHSSLGPACGLRCRYARPTAMLRHRSASAHTARTPSGNQFESPTSTARLAKAPRQLLARIRIHTPRAAAAGRGSHLQRHNHIMCRAIRSTLHRSDTQRSQEPEWQ